MKSGAGNNIVLLPRLLRLRDTPTYLDRIERTRLGYRHGDFQTGTPSPRGTLVHQYFQ